MMGVRMRYAESGREADAQASDTSWKRKYGRLREALDRARADAAEAQRANRLAKHQILDPATLQAVIQQRFCTLRARTQAPRPPEREVAFEATCPAYAAAIPEPPGLVHSIIDGLSWRAPTSDRPGGVPAEWLEKQLRFPYNAILQTRDLVIGGLMLDIGANVGRVAIPRVVLGDVTGVYCAEPDPLNYYCLRRNVQDNALGGYVMPDHVAISDRDGVVGLRRAKKYTGHRVITGGGSDLVEVPACTLDTWVGRHGIDLEAVTFIKVDVEGHEQQVLDGAEGVLRHRHIAWQLEVWAPHLAAAGGSVSRLADTLKRHFTHYIDLSRESPSPRTRPIYGLYELAASLERTGGKTDVMVFHAGCG